MKKAGDGARGPGVLNVRGTFAQHRPKWNVDPRYCTDRSEAETIELRDTDVFRIQKNRYPNGYLFFYSRARDGDRTRDPLLGKEVLHR